MELQHRTLEQLLLEQGRVGVDDLRKIKRLQQERGERLERLLLDLGFISEEDLIPLLSAYLGVDAVHRRDFPQVPVPLGNLNIKFLRHAKALPLAQENGTLTVAMADPADYYTIQGLQLATGLQIQPKIARERDVLEGLETAYGGAKGGENGAAEPAEADFEYFSDDEEDVNHLRDLASEAPVIRFVNLLIGRAVEQRSSDIHIEPFENESKVRYRIDGVLHDVPPPDRRLAPAIVSRIKIMAKLNIAERRLPQDGRIKLRLMGREIDLRVSTLPTLYGESVVLRILDRSSIVVNLDSLGFPEDSLVQFEKLITKPYGMILVTGPTGSGKTTTLYGALDKINSPDKKIITIEDPVEYQLFGVNQIHVKPQIGLTFANGLRSIVRQDPDVIMVGEIRDAETAEIAIQAALTGLLVFSTLHTNDAAGAVSRLVVMGV
jgi:general secretion pathway protein E